MKSGGASTIEVAKASNPCPICVSLGHKSKPCRFYVHTNAYGVAEMLVFKCPTHGEIKRLYSSRPQPVFQQTYVEALTGKKQKPPRQRKEI